MNVRFTGIRPDGTEVILPMPVRGRYDSAEDAPADGLRAEFPLAKSCGTLTKLRVSGTDGSVLFFGTVDIQREITCGTGNVLNLSCRSLAGLLLDSEAVPRTYDAPSLPVIFERHIRPYGFTSFLGSQAICRGELCVRKGMSEWQAAAEFCRKFLRTEPRVKGMVFDASGTAAAEPLLLDNSAGMRYFRAEVRQRNCDILTKIYAPDTRTGLYRLAAEENESITGVHRVRCLANPESDASTVLRKTERSAFSVYAECPGTPATETGASASLRDPVLGEFADMVVAQVRCTWDEDGIRTVYCLRRNV
ncbi:MAG: hypothetical protein ACFWUD_03115 [Thermocaproicibacter melissae]|jgi:hypothetical protein|uniref:hypothetical protein n=1 Tax=Thermocaproicibacter melissae TaxID=2966552 RepID=UPI0024B0B2E2|nr:hypothetical protein [Thermocaproicibacter melissae]WBY63838.1 hypothetical protein NOG13_07675 [Thermocaproicibacter melissae]